MYSKNPLITIGYRVGNLVVVDSTKERKSGYIVWKCRCDCGNYVFLDTRTLQRGSVLSCGCKKTSRGLNNLTGRRFGKLTCIGPTERRDNNGSILWECKCDCGNTCYVSSTKLKNGYKKSCGCLNKPIIKDLVGERFGKLTVTAYAGKHNGMHQWKCRCDCGNDSIVGQSLLLSGKAKSCGCIKKSIYIENFEQQDNTSFSLINYYINNTPANNSSGCTGVYYNASINKWVSQIQFKGKRIYLGCFDDKKDAIAKRKEKELELIKYFKK